MSKEKQVPIETVYKVEGLEFKSLTNAMDHVRKIQITEFVNEFEVATAEDVINLIVNNRYFVMNILKD
jgi:hypothetical protein